MYINQYACLHIRTGQPHAASRAPLLAPTNQAFPIPIPIPTLRGLPALLRRCLLLLVERVQVGGRKAKRRQDLVQLALEVGQVRLERAGGLFTPVFLGGSGLRLAGLYNYVYSCVCMYVVCMCV
jgi:hypothetical protein